MIFITFLLLGSSVDLSIESCNCCDIVTDDDIVTNDAPDTLDLRKTGEVTGVKDQGICESGWAFALVGNIEGQYARTHGKKVDFSSQELLDCLDDCDGCGYCTSGTAMRSLIDLGGVQLESDYPYANKSTEQECAYKPVLSKVKIRRCTNFDLKNEDKLKEVLFKHGPIYIALNSEPLVQYRAGVFKNCPAGIPNHAVLLVGYGSEDGQDYWVIKNSWGLGWGERGFARIRRGINACGLMNPDMASVTIK